MIFTPTKKKKKSNAMSLPCKMRSNAVWSSFWCDGCGSRWRERDAGKPGCRSCTCLGCFQLSLGLSSSTSLSTCSSGKTGLMLLTWQDCCGEQIHYCLAGWALRKWALLHHFLVASQLLPVTAARTPGVLSPTQHLLLFLPPTDW